jgi:hypothetical protein
METGQLTAESKRVAAELGLIKRQTEDTDLSMRGLSRGIKEVKQVLSLISGAAVFGLISSQMGQLVDFGQQFSGKTKEAADNMERLGKFLKTSVGESGLFASIMEGIAWTANAIVIGKTGGFGAAGKDRMAGIKTEAEIQKEKDATESIANSIKLIAQTQKEMNALKRENVKLDSELADLAFERSRFMLDERLQDESALETFNKIQEVQLETINMLKAAPEQIAGGLPDSPVAQLQSELDELVANAGIYQSFFLGLADGFASFGAALVNSGQPLKNFGATFLKLIAQLAVQFGSFLILYGTGMGFVPGGQSFSAGAIAAGIALTVFGGALGALAGKLGGQGGGARGGDRDQRFRDSNFNTSGGNGGTTIINNINFANTIGLTRDSMKEVGEVISAELFKQGKLGRIETVG